MEGAILNKISFKDLILKYLIEEITKTLENYQTLKIEIDEIKQALKK